MPFDNRVMAGTFKGRDLPEKVAAEQGTPENLETTGLQFPHQNRARPQAVHEST
jgi:hypothetical protein